MKNFAHTHGVNNSLTKVNCKQYHNTSLLNYELFFLIPYTFLLFYILREIKLKIEQTN